MRVAMGYGITCVKYLMFFFNFVFTMAGIGMLVVGILMTIKVSSVSDFLASKFFVPPILLIVVGFIVFVIAFYGCCGAVRESSCMVTAFSIFLMTLLVAGIATGVVALVFKDDMGGVLEAGFRHAVSGYITNEADKLAVDSVQNTLGCCGADGPRDYALLLGVPKSCCMDPGVCTNPVDVFQVYQAGCVQQMWWFIKELGELIGALAVGVSFFMVIGIVLGFYMACHFRKREKIAFSIW